MNRWIQAKPRQIRTNRRRPQVESLEQRALLAADPIIAEFLSSNQSILEDGDRESSDWIEVYNQGDESADLEGWYLTDDQRDLTKWVFPSTSVGTNEYLVVFASGKNQLDSKGNLHTNFRLSADGEYLALVQPDGQTIASEFSPEYPRQFTDISYGILMDDAQTDLVSGTSLAQLHVPSDNSLGETWTLPDFAVDESWITTGDDGMPARAAVGFETDSGFAADIQTDVQSLLKGVHPGLYMRIPFVVDNPNAIRELTLELKYDDGYLVYLNGNLMDLRNAPFFKSYDSTASDERPNGEAVVFESTDLEEFLGALQPGENVLAIHAMNVAADDDDFLIVPRLHTAILAVQPDQVGYFSSPTPGKQNANEFSVGPRIDDTSHSPAQPSANDPLVVTAEVNRTLEDVGSVALTYRVMYGDEVQVAMADDGTGLDVTANDGVFTGVIPAGVTAPGQMLRYFVTATDTSDNSMRSPRPIDGSGTDRSPEYFGTVVTDPDLTSDLPIIHWFSENERRGRTRSGTRASVFYQGEFYDNIFVRQRGGATNGNSQKFNFNDDQPFYVNEELGRVAEFNMNAQGSDPSFLRQSLAFKSYTWAGNESSESFLMLMRVNAGLDRVGIFIEQVDQDFLERHGLDPNGALYKFVQRGNLDPVFSDITTGIEKKIPQDNDRADIREVVDGLTQATAEARASSVFDHFNLAQLMNYLAVRSVTLEADDVRKNFYGYRDTNGTGQWSIFPWDKDWTFGIEGDGGPELSHPFFGDQVHRKPNANQWNRLYEAVFNDPVLSEMYLRRLRTVMDELLQPASTPAEDRLYEQRVDELFATAAGDLSASAQRQVDAVKRFFDTRRDTLYNDHTVTDAGPIVDIIPEFATVRYFVPTDDSLGDTWQGIAEPANIADWATGQTGLGYESSDNFVDLIRTPVKPADTCAECNSIYLRMPFNVDDPAAIPALTLRMKYDDGFIAYINGTEVARANYDGAPSYDGTASRTHPNRSATEFENFLIQNHQQLLQTGQNVLAVYSVNRSATNSDQLVLPALVSGAINNPNAAGIPQAQIGNPEVRFGEFSHDPASGNQDEEYIRLDNPNNTAVDISGWTLTGGIEHKFLPGTVIPSNGSLYVSPSVPDFMARTTGPRGGQGLVVQGNYRGHLSNFGESVELAADDGTPMAALTTPVDPSNQQLYLRISEVHYNPPGPGDETEFMELVNISQGNDAVSLDLSGVTIAEGPSEPFVFGDGARLEPGERTLVVKNDAAFRAAYPDVEAALIQGEFLGSLSNGGERIKVNDQGGRTIVDFTYSDSTLWPQRADGSGASLELIDSTRGQERKSYSWRGSVDVGGSPGRAGQQAAGVVINEVRSSSNGREDAIELHNTTSSPIDIGGWFLSDSDDDLLKYEIPAGTFIQAGQYHVVGEEQFNPLPAGAKSFALNGNEGDDVWLVMVDQGQVTSFVDDIHFGASQTATTMGRVPNGVGRLVPLAAPTLGSVNAEPTVGSVVITEVNYHPLEPSDAALQTFSQLDRDDLEFVEITNTTSSPMSLTGWRLRGGVDFDFGEGTTIEAGQSIVITPFNSTRADNAQRTEAFHVQHQIARDVNLVGGYAGRLSDNQDRVQLQMPLPAVDEIIPRVAVDEVIYDDQSPWPIEADGAGTSLHRSTASAFGHDATSWISRTPSPGRYDSVPADLNGDGEVNAADIDRLCQAINQADSAFDLNNSGRTDLADLSFFVQDVLGTNVGDANVDRVFDSSDLVAVFQAGEYEDDIAGNSTWSEGDWNCDGEFNTSDLVAAFQSGAYVGGARRA